MDASYVESYKVAGQLFAVIFSDHAAAIIIHANTEYNHCCYQNEHNYFVVEQCCNSGTAT